MNQCNSATLIENDDDVDSSNKANLSGAQRFYLGDIYPVCSGNFNKSTGMFEKTAAVKHLTAQLQQNICLMRRPLWWVREKKPSLKTEASSDPFVMSSLKTNDYVTLLLCDCQYLLHLSTVCVRACVCVRMQEVINSNVNDWKGTSKRQCSASVHKRQIVLKPLIRICCCVQSS